MVRALASKASPPAAAAAAAAPAADGKSSGSGTAPNVIALGSGEQPFTTQDRFVAESLVSLESRLSDPIIRSDLRTLLVCWG
jgi:hypothetical protein